jgi:hypothetical protein
MCRVVRVTKMTGSSWMIGFISTLVKPILITVNKAISLIYTHIGPLLVPQLKGRNYNSLTESHTLSIAHE